MPRVAFSGRLKSPLSPGVDQAASSDSPLQFVMYLRNFCLYTNFSPPALIPSQTLSRRLQRSVRFIPRPWRFALISFLMSENYLLHLHASTLFDQNAPLYHPCLVLTAYLFATFLVTTCVTRSSSLSFFFSLPFFVRIALLRDIALPD